MERGGDEREEESNKVKEEGEGLGGWRSSPGLIMLGESEKREMD